MSGHDPTTNGSVARPNRNGVTRFGREHRPNTDRCRSCPAAKKMRFPVLPQKQNVVSKAHGGLIGVRLLAHAMPQIWRHAHGFCARTALIAIRWHSDDNGSRGADRRCHHEPPAVVEEMGIQVSNVGSIGPTVPGDFSRWQVLWLQRR